MEQNQQLPISGSLHEVSRYITVDYLGHANMTAFGHEIEGLCLHTCGSHSSPFQVLWFQFCVWDCLSLFSYGLDC